jgi:hypothetical protein
MRCDRKPTIDKRETPRLRVAAFVVYAFEHRRAGGFRGSPMSESARERKAPRYGFAARPLARAPSPGFAAVAPTARSGKMLRFSPCTGSLARGQTKKIGAAKRGESGLARPRRLAAGGRRNRRPYGTLFLSA